MGVLGISVGAGLAAVTLLTVPVFIPALQPRGVQVGCCSLCFQPSPGEALLHSIFLALGYGSWSQQTSWY